MWEEGCVDAVEAHNIMATTLMASGDYDLTEIDKWLEWALEEEAKREQTDSRP